ncbi:hypothetical protein EC973_008980 [Apophysomyces ossiformis]|uniref:Mitochondrial carrier protein n=1 Tax=Apophysomyces ossiformis TaxID=679940 RepID=A0A8H7EQP4_9FUNG|nr:hypothetical protein EC973_008980 [Apophysomyces ossiformis]
MDVIKMRLQTQHVQHSQHIPCCKTTLNGDINRCTWITPIKHKPRRLPAWPSHQIANIHECALDLNARLAAADAAFKNRLVFKGTWDGIYKIAKYEGATALWRGLSPALVMSVPGNVIYFVGYDYLRDGVRPYVTTSKKDYAPLVAGGVARTIAVAIISPIELFRTRLQAATGVNEFKKVLLGVTSMVEKEGLSALWRGLLPTLWRDVPFSAVYWMGYEEGKKAFQAIAHEHNGVIPLNDLHITFLSGALSGMFAATVTTPFDVAKTRRQVDAGRDNPTLKDGRVPAILKQIYKQDGIRGLFRGLSPRIAKVAPSCAIMISSYEVGKSFFAKSHQS